MSAPENEHISTSMELTAVEQISTNMELTAVSTIRRQVDEDGKLIGTKGERDRKRIGLAFQGGGFPAGAVGAGVIKGLAESGLFGPFHGVDSDENPRYQYKYDIVAFSGTSAGALLATLCWAHRIKCKANAASPTQEISEQDISDLIKVAVRHATYYAWPNNFAGFLIPNAETARSFSSFVVQLRENGFDIPLQLLVAPWFHMLTRHWMQASLAAILHPKDDPLDQLFEKTDALIDLWSPILERRPSVPPIEFLKPDINYRTYWSWWPAVSQLRFLMRVLCFDDLLAYNLRKMFCGDPVSELQELAKKLKTEDLPGLAIASSNIFRGENKSFEADDLLTDGLSAVVASGSLDEVNGWTVIKTGKNEGIYLDGAWSDNPPLHAMVDPHNDGGNPHKLNEIWVVEFFPKYSNIIPDTPLKRLERRDQLWQNSLLEHEEDVVHDQYGIDVHRISHNYPTEPKSSLVNNPKFLQEMMSYGYAAACCFADNLPKYRH